MNNKLEKIAKKIIKASFFEGTYSFVDVGKNLDICIDLYYPVQDIDKFINQLNNMKNELNGIASKISKFGCVKEYESVEVDISKVSFHFIFEKDENADDAVIEFLQNNGFQHKG